MTPQFLSVLMVDGKRNTVGWWIDLWSRGVDSHPLLHMVKTKETVIDFQRKENPGAWTGV